MVVIYDIFLSQEDTEPTRSIEDVLCHSRDGFGGIIVKINLGPDEHGIMGNESSPAHIHIFIKISKNDTEIGEANINGTCPKKDTDVVPYRVNKNTEKVFISHRNDIVRWANTIKQQKNGETKSNWEYAKVLWMVGQKNREIYDRKK